MKVIRKIKCWWGHDRAELQLVRTEETNVGAIDHYECKHGCGHTWDHHYLDYDKYVSVMRARGYSQ